VREKTDGVQSERDFRPYITQLHTYIFNIRKQCLEVVLPSLFFLVTNRANFELCLKGEKNTTTTKIKENYLTSEGVNKLLLRTRDVSWVLWVSSRFLPTRCSPRGWSQLTPSPPTLFSHVPCRWVRSRSMK
jgi:hypothetical protein